MVTGASPLSIQELNKISSFEKKYSKEKRQVSYFNIFSQFVQSSYGSKKLFKAFYLSCKWPIHLESVLKLTPDKVKKLIDLKHKFTKINQHLNVTKLPIALTNVTKLFLDIKNNGINSAKKAFKIAKKTAQTILDICIFIQLGELFCLYSVGRAFMFLKASRKSFKFLHGLFVLANDQMKSIGHSKMQKALKTQGMQDERKIQIFHEIRNLHLLKLIKNIALVTLNFFIVFELIFQVVLISATLEIILSTIALTFAIFSHFYKEAMTYSKNDK